MRDFCDAKAMAKTIRAAMAAKGLKISISESLELTAKALGAADWNTLAAAIRTARSDKATDRPPNLRGPEPAPSRPSDQPTRRVGFSPALEATLHRAVALSQTRKHIYTTLEHLLLALAEDADASDVLEACQVDLARLKITLTRYVDEELLSLVPNHHDDDLLELVTKPAAGPPPTAGFHRVIQRAVIHVKSSGRETVTGANVLVAIFSEAESHACFFLTEQGMTRFDAVNFIAHGNRKGDAAA